MLKVVSGDRRTGQPLSATERRTVEETLVGQLRLRRKRASRATLHRVVRWAGGISGGLGVLAVGGLLFAQDAAPLAGCKIKGNISIETGERIYHVPGQEYYDETYISPNKGERWFCSEEDARAAGWRKSRR